MKKLLGAVLALMLCFACAAEEMTAEMIYPAFETYAQAFAELTEEEWEPDVIEQIQMLAPEEGVTVSICLDVQTVVCATVEFPCGQITDCVRAAIENLGWLSEEAIAQAFSLEEGAQLEAEGCIVYRVHGDNRDALSICRAEDAEGMVWQPIHGGKKIHDMPRCSGMDVSRMITAEAAMLTNWEDCGTCRAEKPQTEESALDDGAQDDV